MQKHWLFFCFVLVFSMELKAQTFHPENAMRLLTTLQPELEGETNRWLGRKADDPTRVSIIRQDFISASGQTVNEFEVLFFEGEYIAMAFRTLVNDGIYAYLSVNEEDLSMQFVERGDAEEPLPLNMVFYPDQTTDRNGFRLISYLSEGDRCVQVISDGDGYRVVLAEVIDEATRTKWVVELSTQSRLDLGESPLNLVEAGVPPERLYGHRYQGGLVFFLDTENEYPDLDVLVAAPADQTFRETQDEGSFIEPVKWICESKLSEPQEIRTADAIGAGKANTDRILAACAGDEDTRFAAKLCRGVGPDWHLPSITELRLMLDHLVFDNTSGISYGFSGDTFYWSSSEGSDNSSWTYGYDGLSEQYQGNESGQVRAVKAVKLDLNKALTANITRTANMIPETAYPEIKAQFGLETINNKSFGAFLGGLSPKLELTTAIQLSGENIGLYPLDCSNAARLTLVIKNQDGAYQLIDNQEVLREVFAPIDTPEEALSFVHLQEGGLPLSLFNLENFPTGINGPLDQVKQLDGGRYQVKLIVSDPCLHGERSLNTYTVDRAGNVEKIEAIPLESGRY